MGLLVLLSSGGGSFLLGFQVGVEITMPIAFAAEAWPVMTWKIVFTSCKEESFLKGFFPR